MADDRSGDVVVRLCGSLGGRTRVRVVASFSLAIAGVRDLLEREDAEVAALAPARVDGDAVDLALGPFQVVTLRLRPAGGGTGQRNAGSPVMA